MRLGILASALFSALSSWVPAGALSYYDFEGDRGYSGGIILPSSTSNLTVSRASIGYDLAATTQFAANVARRTGAGLLVEGAGTNSAFPSRPPTTIGTAFNANSWGANSQIPWSGNSVAAPDGTTTAGTAQFPTGSTALTAFAYTLANQALSGASAGFTVKGPAGSQIYFHLDAAAAPYNRQLVTFTGNWQRIKFENQTQANGAKYIYMTTGDRVNSTTQLPAVNVVVADVQFEAGSAVLTSYIPTTTAAATRAADNITVPVPSAANKVDLVYSNGNTNTVIVTPGSTYTLPANAANSNLRNMKFYAA